MGFINAIRICFSKYVDFQGRARRSEYWFWVLFVIIGYVATVMIDVSIIGPVTSNGFIFGALNTIFILAILLPNLAVTVRRLHDSGKSGWWVLLGLIPFGGIVILIFTLMPGDSGPNKYGADPKGGGVDPVTFS